MATATADINETSQAGVHLQKNQVEEFTEVITQRFPSFYGIALGRVRNSADAEDAVQDALLSAYTHLYQFKGTAKMSTWVTTIVINSANTRIRARLRQSLMWLDSADPAQNHSVDLATLSDGRPTPEDLCRRRELMERVMRLSQRLPPMMHRAIELRYVYGLSIREIAQALGTTEGTAKVCLSRARSRLRQSLRESEVRHNCPV